MSLDLLQWAITKLTRRRVEDADPLRWNFEVRDPIRMGRNLRRRAAKLSRPQCAYWLDAAERELSRWAA